jgi:hypothetical protein
MAVFVPIVIVRLAVHPLGNFDDSACGTAAKTVDYTTK